MRTLTATPTPTTRPGPAALLLAAAALLGGCTHKVQVLSDPPGAEVMIGRKSVGVTPVQLEVKPWKLGTREVKVKAVGRRTATFKVPLFKRKSTHELVLVRKHGPSGTWEPEDAEQ
jgi:hypothetical protein